MVGVVNGDLQLLVCASLNDARIRLEGAGRVELEPSLWEGGRERRQEVAHVGDQEIEQH